MPGRENDMGTVHVLLLPMKTAVTASFAQSKLRCSQRLAGFPSPETVQTCMACLDESLALGQTPLLVGWYCSVQLLYSDLHDEDYVQTSSTFHCTAHYTDPFFC